ncbi:MAG: nitrogen fixation protein NifH [Actinomycetota bacterium]
MRHLALTQLLDEPPDAPVVRRARAAAMKAEPIASILRNQDAEGWWVKQGAGYGPKYTGTVWSLTFLEQMGADGRDPRIQRACDHVLAHTQAPGGGFGWQATNSAVVHCLNGNLLRALLVFGRFEDPRVRASIDWETRAITGEYVDRWYRWATSGPGFGCGINGTLPCGWGAIKAMRGLAAIPPRRRTKQVRRALAEGAAFLLDHGLATGAFPTDSTISANWTRFGFPSGYVADALQGLEVLVEVSHGRDPRLAPTVELVLGKQDDHGRWRNEHGYRGKLWVDTDPPRAPSKWVTLRACRALKGAVHAPR